MKLAKDYEKLTQNFVKDAWNLYSSKASEEAITLFKRKVFYFTLWPTHYISKNDETVLTGSVTEYWTYYLAALTKFTMFMKKQERAL